MAAVIKPYSAEIDFRRQNLTSIDVRFWRLKSTPALQEYTIYNGHNTGIQMKRKELTSLIHLWWFQIDKNIDLHDLHKLISTPVVLNLPQTLSITRTTVNNCIIRN